MANYLVIDADWLDIEIEKAVTLREHAQSTGKAVAIAAAGIRLESLREIRRIAQPALGPDAGKIRLSIDRPPTPT